MPGEPDVLSGYAPFVSSIVFPESGSSMQDSTSPSVSPDLTDLIQSTFIDFTQTREFLKQPVVITHADRITYWDVNGKDYLDALSGVYAVSLGHNHPRLKQALMAQLDRVTLAPPMHGIAEISLQLVSSLRQVTPPGLDFVKSFSGGSEANEAALKFARQYHKLTGNPGKFKTVSFYSSYHGATAGAMAASGTGIRKTQFEPQMAGFLKIFPPSHFRDVCHTWEECNDMALHMARQVIENEDPATIAGLIMEPIIHLVGIGVPTRAFLSGLRALCDEHNILLIFDEIITGMGRTGWMFAAQAFDVTPDILCCGKGLSSGVLPLSAMITRREMADAFLGEEAEMRHFGHGHTFASHALASAVGIEVIKVMEEDQVCANTQAQGKYLKERLNQLKSELPIAKVRGEGLLVGFDLVKEPGSEESSPELGAMFKQTALAHGLVLRVQPTWGAMAPALVCHTREIDQILERFRACLLDAWDRIT